MQKTEREYLDTLRVRLSGYVGREDLDDIISDYAEHFSIGKAEGRSEEDLFRALGSPEDTAREIRATYLVKKAEHAGSAENMWHAVMATLGLGLFNLVFVLVPFILLIVLLAVIFVAGVALLIIGPIMLLVAIMQQFGVVIITPWWSSPISGILIAIGLSIAAVVMIIADIHLARFFYHHTIRYLKWNIRVIRGGETTIEPEESVQKTTVIRRDGATALNLQLRLGAGEITLGEGTDEQALVTLSAGNEHVYSETMCNAVKRVRIHGRHSLANSCLGDESAYVWDILLNRGLPVALDIGNKAGRTRLSLGKLSLSSLKIRNGVGETCIDLAGYHGGSFDAIIKNGVGSLVIRVPRESNLRISIHRGVGDIYVTGLIAEGDTYVLHAPHPDAPMITCMIKQGVGSISLEAV